MNETQKVTKEDIKRNIEHVENGEALDLPLCVLDRVFKLIWYRKGSEFRSGIERCRKNNPEKYRMSARKYYYIHRELISLKRKAKREKNRKI